MDRIVAVAVPTSLVAYAPLALTHRWWLSGLAAPAVAWLLANRHPRARFSAYVLLSVIVIRSLVVGPAWLAAGAAAVIVTLQTASATRRWPRVRPGSSRAPAAVPERGDRMAPP